MNAAGSLPAWRGASLVGRGIWIELVRRKDLYVLGMLMGIFALGVLAAMIVGIEEASTANFLLNLGLSLAYYCAHILALTLMARQIPDELENRTVYPLLAKPIAREWYLAGKWGAVTLGGFASFLVLGLMGWLPVPRMETYSTVMLLQTLTLIFVSLALLASLALVLSLLMPKGLTVVVVGLLFAAGHQIVGFVRLRFSGSPLEGAAQWALAYLPDFSKLNTITRYTDGIGPLSAGEFLGLVAHGAVLTGLALALAVALFHRRPL